MYEVISQSLRSLVDFTDEELFLFMQKLKPATIKKHAFYLKEGLICKNMAIIHKGCFRHYFRGEKGEHTVQFFFEGDWIGDYDSFLRSIPSEDFIEALENSEIFTLSYADQQALYKQSQRFETFGRLIAESLFITSAKQKRALLMQTAEERYLELLNTNPKIFERLPQHLIASFLGIQPPSLSRIKAKLFSRPKINSG